MRGTLTVVLLGAAATVWSAVPLGGTGWSGGLFVVIAVLCVVAGLVRLSLKDRVREEQGLFAGGLASLVDGADRLVQSLPWETGAAISVLVLETLHRSRPWHTGLLAVLLVCYLLAVNRAESAVPSAVFRGQARMLATSAALLVLVTGVAMVPSARTGALSGWLDILAALAAMAAGGLALPV
jgi:hypothetical protein